jgi:predicted nucleic acid-binding protein
MNAPPAKPVFIDTTYILAYFLARDRHHDRARQAARRLAQSGGEAKAVTTEAVLTVVCNALSRHATRAEAVKVLRALRANPNLEVLPVDAVLFDNAVSMYAERMDKEWGLTDCVSFVVMRKRGLTQALTIDRHFEQAGFQLIM